MPQLQLRHTAYNSLEEVGNEIIQGDPRLSGRDPTEIGTMAVRMQPNIRIVEGYGDIDLGEAAGTAIGDFAETGKESIAPLGKMLSPTTNPMERGKEVFDFLSGLGKLGAGGVSNVTGIESISSDEGRQAASQFADEYKRSLSPAGIQERPVNAVSNIPILPGALGKIGKLGKAGKFGKTGKVLAPVATVTGKAMEVADPSQILFEAPGTVKKTTETLRQQAQKRAAQAERMGTRATKIFDPIRSEGDGLIAELSDAASAFTTGTSNQYRREMRKRAGSQVYETTDEMKLFGDARKTYDWDDLFDEMKLFGDARKTYDWDDLFRQGRNRKTVAEQSKKIIVDSFKAVDRVMKDAGIAHRQGTEKFFTGTAPKVSTRGLGGRIKQIASDFDIDIDSKTGKARLTDSEIAEIGKSREVVGDAITKFVNLPDQMDAKTLHKLRKRLDDKISTFSPEGDISASTRSVLTKIRRAVAEQLESELGPEYVDAMRDYSKAMIFLDDVAQNLRLHPGQIDKFDLAQTKDIEKALASLSDIFSDDFAKSQRLGTFNQLEELAGNTTMTPRLMGLISNPLTGSGLVVKSETAQIGRQVIRALTVGGAGSVNLLLTFPAAAVFSPRAMSELTLQIAKRARNRGAKAKPKEIQQVIDVAQRANRESGGELAKMATREGWSIETMLNRISEQVGDEEESGNFLQKLGRSESPVGRQQPVP